MPTDIQTLIGEVAARNHCRIEDGDPIFAVSTINRLMLDEVVEGLIVRVRAAITAFETSARAVEAHAGKLLAEEIRGSTSAWKAEIARDIHLAHTRPAMLRWGALGAFAAMLFLGCGIFIGFYFR
jgi:hypothetical protein